MTIFCKCTLLSNVPVTLEFETFSIFPKRRNYARRDATSCVLRLLDGKPLGRAVVKRHYKDTPNAALGRKYALKRAIALFPRNERRNIWKQYLGISRRSVWSKHHNDVFVAAFGKRLAAMDDRFSGGHLHLYGFYSALTAFCRATTQTFSDFDPEQFKEKVDNYVISKEHFHQND